MNKPNKSKSTKKSVSNKRPAKVIKQEQDYALILRTCDAKLQGYNNFQWPRTGPVSCPDWNPSAVCGGGLHGLLWGIGAGNLLNHDPSAIWLVVKVLASEVVAIGTDKVKFPRGEVMYAGDKKTATDMIAKEKPGTAIVGLTQTAGDRGTATAGDAGTATAGDRGTATAGDAGTATAGDAGTATAGDAGTATAGYRGTATAGYRGTATAGYRGTATAGYRGTATAGDDGILNIRWYDGKRYRIATFYVGENGIESGQPYKVDEQGKPFKVQK